MSKKSALEELTRKQEIDLREELELVAEKGKSVLSNTFLVVGGLALTYMIFKALTSEEPKKKKNIVTSDKTKSDQSGTKFSHIVESLAEGASLFLLGMAKEKLAEYLNVRDESSEGNKA